jgi:hypothetical protein
LGCCTLASHFQFGGEKIMKRIAIRALCLSVGAAMTVFAAPVVWTDWTAATNGNTGAASGIITPSAGPSIDVAYSGEVFFAQTAGGTNYWNPGTPYMSATVSNAPPAADIVSLIGGHPGVNTVTFSSPVTNPIMAILSLGQPGFLITYDFDAPFDVLSFGPGYWGPPGTLTELPGDVLQGNEGHGAIQFQGTFSSISWTTPVAENWHGFTVGVPESTIPEPANWTIGLLGSLTLVLARLRASRRL